MNGPQHYREAERCLGEATQFAIDTDACHGMHLRAQVHATLALAAAQVQAADPDDVGIVSWVGVLTDGQPS